jgi:hypothetical protein
MLVSKKYTVATYTVGTYTGATYTVATYTVIVKVRGHALCCDTGGQQCSAVADRFTRYIMAIIMCLRQNHVPSEM